MKVAAVQHDIVWEDTAANLDRLSARIDEAAALGARLVVLPEMFATGFSMNTGRTSELDGGPTTAWLRERSGARDVWVCGTVAETPGDGGRPSNMFVLAAPDGAVHRYAKVHTFSHTGEHEHFAAGDRLVTVGVDGLRVTPFVCYDLRFADEFWTAGPGTDLFVVPANWPASRREQWRTLARARAIENQCYLVGVNRVGEGDGVTYAGDSCIIDPIGRTLVEAAEVETILVADVDAEVVAATRRRFDFLSDRRS
ncbi:MAG: nitrilase-related carbon-nitrogen hydrolase [Acidimicrobiales bacterium]